MLFALLQSLAVSVPLQGAGPAPATTLPTSVPRPPFDPVFWLDVDHGVLRGLSNLVSRWDDRGDEEHDLFGRNGATLPYYDQLGFELEPCLRFDGNDVLERPDGMPLGDYTKVLLVRVDEFVDDAHLLSSEMGHGLSVLADGRLALSVLGAPFAASVEPLVLGQAAIVVATFDADSGTGRLYIDGRFVGQGTAGVTNLDSRIQLGGLPSRGHLRGLVVEALLYGRELGRRERHQVERYLAESHLGRAPAPLVQFTRIPLDGAVFPRDGLDLGDLEVEGVVSTPGFTEAVLEITRDGSFWQRDTEPLVYVDGQASFALFGTVRAELVQFAMTVSLVGRSGEVVVGRRDNLICGDLFLVQGQSNAEAFDHHAERVANAWETPWVRSFGAAKPASLTAFDNHWDLARALVFDAHASPGAWAVRMGANLVSEFSVPIGILNGAEGGTFIADHQRDDAQPTDLETPYGRLLYRVQSAGVADQIKALIWYQGEADAAQPSGYEASFAALRADWLEDFVALEKIYVVQVRQGCGQAGPGVRETQRTLVDLFPDVELMSTTAVPGHDGCHFFAVGYAEIGDRMSRLLARDFFGSLDTLEVEPPNVESAEFVTSTRVLVTFRNDLDILAVEPGGDAYFVTDDPSTFILNSIVDRNTIELRLNAPSTATTISYLGHAGDGPWVTNVRGVGALTFFDLPVRR